MTKRLRPITALLAVGLVLAGMMSSLPDMARATAEPDDNLRVEETRDLQALAQEAKNKRVPMVVMFSQKGCAYCELVEQAYLIPMLRNPEYNNKVVIRKIRVDNFDQIRNFDGKHIAADSLSTNYHAFVTPTVVFLGPDGKELSHRLVGVSNEYYYGYDLDQAIDQSLMRLRQVALK